MHVGKKKFKHVNALNFFSLPARDFGELLQSHTVTAQDAAVPHGVHTLIRISAALLGDRLVFIILIIKLQYSVFQHGGCK